MCGIIGFGGNPHSAHEAYQGLQLMQHRGQDAAGILSYFSQKEQFFLHKNQGLISDVFNPENIDNLPGEFALGHTRYTTVGQNHYQDTQPLITNYPYGIGLVHNGNLVNYHQLVKYLKEEKHRYIFSNNDAEIILNLISDELAKSLKNTHHDIPFSFDILCQAVLSLMEKAEGAYSVIGLIAHHGIFAFRDPQGIRPLHFGSREETKNNISQNKNSFCFASETNVLKFLSYDYINEINPGELVFIDLEGKIHRRQLIQKKSYPCMFEWVYFANPDSSFSERNTYDVRTRLGDQLAKQIQKDIRDGHMQPDCIAPVPETSRISTQSMNETLKLPYKELLIKNRYIQRSFILPHQEARENAVDLKLMAIQSEVQGKNILLIDDSLVRGTTSKRIIKILKNAGANKIYLALTCPPIKYPCFYGIDFPESKELMAFEKNNEQIAKEIGADRVIFLDLAGLKEAIKLPQTCTACLNGEYCTNQNLTLNSNNANFRKGHMTHEELSHKL